MAFKDWDDIPYTANDCARDYTEWNNMITYIRHSACTDFTIYEACPGTGQAFRFSRYNTTSRLYGGAASGDVLEISANDSDTYPRVWLFGASDIWLDSYDEVFFKQQGTQVFSFDLVSGDSVINSGTSNENIYLAPNGTGKIKFGTHTTLGAETVTGYIEIIDSSGVARKLAVVS